MEVNVEKPAASLAKVSFSVPRDEFEREVASGLRQVSRSVRMKGFRPGKVPAKVLESRFGVQVRGEVREQFLRKAYQQAIEEHELRPMTHPRITPDELESSDGGLQAAFEVNLRPDVELPEYAGIAVASELEQILDENVEQAISGIKQEQATPEPAGDGGLGENGLALCEVEFRHGDEVVFQREGLRLYPHTPPPGVDPEAFSEAFLGATTGAEFELEMTLPESIEQEQARGQPGTCRLLVKEAFEMVEPSDQDLFGLLEVEDQDGLRRKVRERLEQAAAERERMRIETTLLDRVITEARIELPAPLIEEQTLSRLEQLRERLTEQGTEEEQIEAQLNEQAGTAREEAEKGMRALLIVEAIGEKEELLVTQEDMDAELGTIAERNRAEVDEVRQYYSENNLMQQMAIEILERKVRAFLREHAEVGAPS